MGKHYQQLGAEERAYVMLSLQAGSSQRGIARELRRSVSTINRELKRNCRATDASYDAVSAGQQARQRQKKVRRPPKLLANTVLLGIVRHYLKEGWSPQQISGRLKDSFPDEPENCVSHETIYTTIYAMPRGELRKDLIRYLRKGHDGRRTRSQGVDRRGCLPEMTSIHDRPPEVEDRLIPGHWEADLIKGAGNRSAVATLVERTSRLVLLAKMPDASAASALEAFSMALNRIDEPQLRLTFTYDQGREMSRHRELSERTGVRVYFADPHSPWQRGSNENANGLIREYLPKGTDLSVYSQEQLDDIARRLNTRPRKILNFKMPAEVFRDALQAISESRAAVKH